MTRLIVIVAALAFPLAGTAAAQPARSFEQLGQRVVPGDIVSILEADGVETNGRIASLSSGLLTIALEEARRTFVEDQVVRISRYRRDSVKDGILLGGGTGAVIGFGLGRRLDTRPCRPGIECGQGAAIGTINGAVWGAVAGWLVDSLHRRREVIFSR